MKLENLDDQELERAANGAASQVLHNRRQRQRQKEKERQAAKQEQTAKQAFRSLSDEEIRTLAQDPRTLGNQHREREAWESVPGACWDDGWSKSECVASAKDLLQHRRRQRAQATRQRQSPGGWQGPLGTVNLGGREVPVLYLAGGAVAAGAVAKAATGE